MTSIYSGGNSTGTERVRPHGDFSLVLVREQKETPSLTSLRIKPKVRVVAMMRGV